ILPDRIANREKVPFVYGVGMDHTRRMIIRLLTANDRELVRAAVGGDRAADRLDSRAVHLLLDRLEAGDRSVNVIILLSLVNLGLLDSLVSDLPPAMVDWPAPPVPVAS